MSTATAARLSAKSEGLWLVAAFGGVLQLPPVLKVRPIGSVEPTVADHPGVAELERAGVVKAGTVDPDVATWVATLGRPDIEVDVVITRPDDAPAKLLGPPSLFEPPDDPFEAAQALTRWHAQQPAQRVCALCRRDGTWVSVARLWQTGSTEVDEIVVAPLGTTIEPGAAVCDVLGPATPTDFEGLNTETAKLMPVLSAWQANPRIDLIDALVRIGLSVPQARAVRAAVDVGATQAVISAAQFCIDGSTGTPLAVTVADTVMGRILITNALGSDGRQWTTLLPGTGDAIEGAVAELLETLPCGPGWRSHKRVEEFAY